MNYYGISDMGKVRKNNEDFYKVKSYAPDTLLAVIADGMGGTNAGEVASKIAVDTIFNMFESQYDDFVSFEDRKIKQSITTYIKHANELIYNKSLENTDLKGMGTTIVVALYINNALYIANVGDSRLYIISDTNINQITKDHSYVQELLQMGMISDEQAKSHPQKNVITRALGTDKNIEIDMYKETLDNTNKVLLCTDGLTNMITDDQILSITNNGNDLSQIVNTLVASANSAGGKDNITAVVMTI